MKQKHQTDVVQPPVTNFTCTLCDKPNKTKSGLTSHMRHKHPEHMVAVPAPIKIMPSTPSPVSPSSSLPSSSSLFSQSTVAGPDDLTCAACQRTCATLAGLRSHQRNVKCRQLLKSGIVGV
ncbi:hypothetical protein WDU94_012182 [Cyamophila willieti]